MTNSQPTIWRSSNSRQSEFGCALMSPRPSLILALFGCTHETTTGPSNRRAQMAEANEVAINHLQRRKNEGRVLIPFLQVLRGKFGEGPMREVVDETIRKLAAEDGARWAATFGRTTASLRKVAEDLWAAGGS